MIYVALVVVCLIGFCLSLLVGPSAIGVGAALDGLFGGGSEAIVLIMTEVRLPRAILALGIGAVLGLSGAALQGFLRNPLAEPGLIGVSAASALGAVVAFYFGLVGMFALALPISGLLGGLIAILTLSALVGRGGTLTFILAGIAISSLASALTALALSLAPSPFASAEILFWLLGSIADRSMSDVGLAMPFMVASILLLMTAGRALDALTIGEDAAESLGFGVGRVRAAVVLGTACGVGAATAVSGVIGFVGLVVPHLLRPFVAHKPSRLLPASALGGAAMVLFADVAVRVIPSSGELRLGVLTALVGAPFFLLLILRARRGAI